MTKNKLKLDLEKKLESYIRHSYRYYVLNDPIISDHEYDILCQELYNNHDKLNVERLYVFNINKDMLKSGSGYGIRYEFNGVKLIKGG